MEVIFTEPITKRRIKRDDPERYLNQPGDYPDQTTTVSATETTGMIPAPPQTNAQYASYQDMYGMQIPKQLTPDDETL